MRASEWRVLALRLWMWDMIDWMLASASVMALASFDLLPQLLYGSSRCLLSSVPCVRRRVVRSDVGVLADASRASPSLLVSCLFLWHVGALWGSPPGGIAGAREFCYSPRLYFKVLLGEKVSCGQVPLPSSGGVHVTQSSTPRKCGVCW